jgi:3-hydroxy-3-methylglutaryl CoA synthase/NAD(P)-dependent dehydrogenase (short-subunit alcohol dehydrogenase family)/putative sterol carrier protein
LRLNRTSIFQNVGWLAPAVVMVAQGERSFCNWDEDSVTMAVAACRDCLSGVDRSSVDALYLASTTLPFADRLNAGIVATALNLRDDILTADLTSSLKAGTSALVAALEAVKSGERKSVLVAASDRRETRAASFYEMWYGDGAASILVGEGENVIAEFKGAHSVSYDFVDHYRGAQKRFDYTWEERWMREEGYARIIPEAISGLLARLDISMDDVDRVIYPCFIKRQHAAIARIIGAAPEKVVHNMHTVCGETGAAHPLLMLVRALAHARPGDRILVAGFGQGCDALCFEVTAHVDDLPARSDPLSNARPSDNYIKFLKFRDLIVTETGIRAEAPNQTAMTALWRRRKTILGLVGGKCTECGTPQFPRMDVCVNPACGAFHSQEDYEFADRPATVKSFTGDMLAVSVDPPAIYGMVQFEGGGRMMADFTDCALDDLEVGQAVRMVFRRHHTDEERGFTGYFWKAVPMETRGQGDKETVRFDDRVAIVTGAGGGLGRVYALELAKRGARVVVNDLGGARDGSGSGSARPADAVVQEIVAAGGEAVANYDSVATVEGGARIVATALEHFGRVDVLINNAGILRDKSFAKMTPEQWNGVLDVHLQGAYNVTQPAFRAMRENGYGRIVMISSVSGLFGNFGQTNYSAAKMGLVGLMNTLKLEGNKYGVKVNTVAPTAATRMTEDVMPPDLADKLEPELVAPLVIFLCSERCADTGLILHAGGGFFNRIAVSAAPTVPVGDGERIPTLEEIHRHWAEIDGLEGGRGYPDANAFLMDVLMGQGEEETGGQGDAASLKETGGQGETVQAVFERMGEFFQAQAAGGVDVVFQFNVSGAGGGDWHVTVRDKTCAVEAGVHSKPTTTLKMADVDFLALVAGKLPAMQAFTSGKLKIEGDLMKSQLVEKLFKW